MKMVLSILFLAAMSSATSIKRYDVWSCTFPNTKSSASVIRGTAVQINFDIMTGQGTAVMYPICPACRVVPRKVAVERAYTRDTLIYKNQLAGFYMAIGLIKLQVVGAGNVAYLDNKTAGVCYAQ